MEGEHENDKLISNNSRINGTVSELYSFQADENA